MTFGEAYDYWERLSVEWGTHTHAAVAGWSFPASFGDVMQMRLTERALNYWRGADDPVIEMPKPWPNPDHVPAEVRSKYEAILQKRSAFGDR